MRNERGSYDLFVDSEDKKMIVDTFKTLCKENSTTVFICEMIYYSICGVNKEGLEMDPKILTVLFPHLSNTGSGKQFDHFFQLIKSGEFRQFDYHENNSRVYNSSKPPLYKLANVKAPTFLYSADCDVLVSEKDVDDLEKVLPNVRSRKSFKNYNHCDFNYGKNSPSLFYKPVLNVMLGEN